MKKEKDLTSVDSALKESVERYKSASPTSWGSSSLEDSVGICGYIKDGVVHFNDKYTMQFRNNLDIYFSDSDIVQYIKVHSMSSDTVINLLDDKRFVFRFIENSELDNDTSHRSVLVQVIYRGSFKEGQTYAYLLLRLNANALNSFTLRPILKESKYYHLLRLEERYYHRLYNTGMISCVKCGERTCKHKIHKLRKGIKLSLFSRT